MSFDYSLIRQFKLNATISKGSSRVCNAFESFHITNKKIEKILILGAEDRGGRAAHGGLKGKPDYVRFICFILEPLVIVFDDGTTLGVQMVNPFSFRLGYNIIPATITRGINQNHLDGEATFSFLKGMRITGAECIEKNNTGIYRHELALRIIFEKGKYILLFSCDFNGWCKVSILNENDSTIVVPKSLFKEERKQSEVLFFDALLPNSSFNFIPCSDNEFRRVFIDGCWFGVEEYYYTDKLLTFFLSKYYEKSINSDRVFSSSQQFGWHYSVLQMQLMIQEMKKFKIDLNRNWQVITKVFSSKDEIDEISESVELEPEESIIHDITDFIDRFCEIITGTIEDFDVTYYLINKF